MGRRVSVPGGQPQLERSTSSAGSSSAFGLMPGPGDAVQKPGARLLAQQPHRLVNGRERRVAQAGGEDVVEADHRDLLGHPHPGCGERPEHPDGHQVVRADDRVRQLLAAGSEQFRARLLAAVDGERTLRRADKLAARVSGHQIGEREAALLRVRGAGRPVHVIQPPPAVVLDEVGHQRGGAGPVVGDHHVGRALVRVPGDDDHGQPLGQPGQERPTAPCLPRSACRRPCPDSDSSRGRSGSLAASRR